MARHSGADNLRRSWARAGNLVRVAGIGTKGEARTFMRELTATQRKLFDRTLGVEKRADVLAIAAKFKASYAMNGAALEPIRRTRGGVASGRDRRRGSFSPGHRGESDRENKSQMIRDYLSTDPTATPKAIKQHFANQGIKIGEFLISRIKYQQHRNEWHIGASEEDTTTTMDGLLAVKHFAAKVGGVDQARKVLSLLAQLVS